MVTVDKTPLPEGVTIKSEADYRRNPVLDLLHKDCHSKCYICEDEDLTAINVEHRISQHNNPALKYDWNNLFLSCKHCNETKGTAFDDIIDPVNVNPEEYIELAITTADDLRKKVIVSKTVGSEERHDVDTTIRLLERVYNEGTTAIKQAECRALKNKILKEVNWFLMLIDGYKEENDSGYHNIIIEAISRSSVFAAFKRKMIRDDPQMAHQFAEALR